jgi:sugar lactone lactonase YvrE
MIATLKRTSCAAALLAGIVALSGCGGSDTSPAPPPPPPPPTSPTPTHHIGGSVTGLGAGASAGLSAGSGNVVTVSANGAYTFPGAINEGAGYTVTVTQQPTTQQCTLSNASGSVAAADVTNITLACADLPTLGGTLTGLGGGASVALLNGSDRLVLTADGAFTFANRLRPGDAYSVTVDVQPTGETCVATNGSGTIAQVNVTNVTVVCTPAVANLARVSFYAGDMGGAGQSDGSGTAARFRSPGGAVADPATGALYIADTGNRAIRRIDANGAVTTFAGKLGEGGSTDGQGSAARFLSPAGITRDGAGNLYVTDAQMHVIRKITPDGTVSTLAGFAAFSGSADGTGTAARFKNPSAIAVDAGGNLFVADTNNFTIRKVTPQGVVTTIAGIAGTAGHADALIGQQATFFGPSGIAVTSLGTVFVADSVNAAIRAIAPTGEVTTVAGTAGSVGYRDGIAQQAQFDNPVNLVYSESTATLYIADSINGVVRSLTGNTVATVAGDADERRPVDGGPNAGRMHLPIGIAMMSPTTLYITENNFHTVRRVSTDGSIATIAGEARGWQFTSADGIGDAARFLLPGAITTVTGHPGTLRVADSSDDTIREITPAAGSTLLGSVATIVGTPGIPGVNYGAVPVGGDAALLRGPQGVSASGLIADSNNLVIARLDAAGNVSLFSGAPSPAPQGFVDGDAAAARFFVPGGLSDGPAFTYVADIANNAIRQISRVDGSVITLAGDGHSGVTDGAAARFNHPQSVLYVSDGIVVADTVNNSIRKVLFSGGTITLAGHSGESGTADGPALDARFKLPTSVAADAAGNLYIADSGNFTIRKLTPAGEVTTIAGQLGLEGFTPGDVGVLSAVHGLVMGDDGALYATMYQGVVRITLP